MKNVKSKASVTKRIMRDLKEIQDNPILGCTLIALNESDPFLLHANIKILEGTYKGLIFHLEIKLPDTFSLHAPWGRMAPGFPQIKHEHVFEENGICTDFLANFEGFFQQQTAAGWTSSTTLKQLLIVLQPFLADHEVTVSQSFVENLKSQIDRYQCGKCGHKTGNPYPAIPTLSGTEQSQYVSNPKSRAEQYLICSVMKQSFFQDKGMVLGYPIKLSFDYRNGLETEIITDLLSYDSYVLEILRAGENKIDNFLNVHFRSPTGKQYNN